MRRTLVVIAAFLLGGLLMPRVWVTANRGEAQTPDGLSASVQAGAVTLGPEELYARAARSAGPSVVNIDTVQRTRGRVFDIMGVPREDESTSSGSGVIITSDGYILTNEHVVGGRNSGSRITVSLADGRSLPGTLVGADRQTDVALVKVEAANLPAARLRSTQGLTPGQMVVAIGSPLGLRFTVSHGVVSALQRPVELGDRVYADLVQHDALINPGNSGGALVNLQGQVVGINTLVARTAQGIGFAIPIDTAMRTANDLKRYGKVKRPWLGVAVVDNEPYFVQRFGVANAQGAMVRAVYRNSPADEAGLEPGDVVSSVAGQPVRSAADYRAAEGRLRIGDQVEVIVQRPGGAARVRLAVGEAP